MNMAIAEGVVFLEADKRAIRIEPGEKYIRKFDISEYMNYKVIDISARLLWP